ncbi:MAG: fumarylacetoacetate hydrolase family protein [Christensenellales bacterium]|jgi:2-keto-4-pentenoate hydratase/2-oxohepta-3-ene-1,7-dioic acid hydratase in catechol pathway
MRTIRFTYEGYTGYGEVRSDKVHVLDRAPYLGANETGVVIDLADVRLLAPCVPGKIIAVGVNYSDHAAEVNFEKPPEEPLIFMKPPSSVIGPDVAIEIPAGSQSVDHECELAVVIGRRCRNVRCEDALSVVYGYTCLNDVSERAMQKKDGQWVRAKGFDTFCPLGPWIETDVDPADLIIRSILNGEIKQDSTTALLLNPVDKLIEFISGIMTLEPGDVIATGTPSGVSPMRGGDEIEIFIEGIGSLKNPVVAL